MLYSVGNQNMKTMKVPSFIGNGRIKFEERAIPEPGPGELVIQVKANAVCGSERGQFYNGSKITPGHEASGIVFATGARTHTAVGTKGVIFLMDFCGTCRSCRQGLTNQCLNKRADMGFSHDGGYGAYELIRENIFFPIDADLNDVEATLLLDIMGTGGHSIGRAQRVHPDITSLMVLGAGPIGLGILAMARLIFGEQMPVIIADVIPYRLALAERLGGKTIDLKKDNLEAGLRKHGVPVVDAVIDSTGKDVARQAGLEVLDKRGVFVCVGHGGNLTVDVSRQLISTERAILGSEYFCFNEFDANLARLRKNRAYLSQIITHRFPVEDIQAAFELFWKGDTGKIVVEQ